MKYIKSIFEGFYGLKKKKLIFMEALKGWLFIFMFRTQLVWLTFCPSVLHPSSVLPAEPAAVRVHLRAPGFGVGAPRQPADRPSGHAGGSGQRPGHAVPQQHQQGGGSASLRRLRLSMREGAAGRRGRDRSPGRRPTRNIREQTGSAARHQWTLHTPHGVLRPAWVCQQNQEVDGH